MKKSFFAVVMFLSVVAPFSFSNAESLLIYSENREQDVFRVDTVTGEAYLLTNIEATVPRWIRIKETGRVEEGNYKFVAVVTGTGTKIIRMDKRTGESWIAGTTSAWRKMLEP